MPDSGLLPVFIICISANTKLDQGHYFLKKIKYNMRKNMKIKNVTLIKAPQADDKLYTNIMLTLL